MTRNNSVISILTVELLGLTLACGEAQERGETTNQITSTDESSVHSSSSVPTTGTLPTTDPGSTTVSTTSSGGMTDGASTTTATSGTGGETTDGPATTEATTGATEGGEELPEACDGLDDDGDGLFDEGCDCVSDPGLTAMAGFTARVVFDQVTELDGFGRLGDVEKARGEYWDLPGEGVLFTVDSVDGTSPQSQQSCRLDR